MNYARILNGIVVNVIVADEQFIAIQEDKDDFKVLTRGGIGWTYHSNADVFIAPQPFESWTLDSNHDWQPPTPRPTEGRWAWNEAELEWIAVSLGG